VTHPVAWQSTVESALARTDERVDDLLRRLHASARVDIASIPPSAASWLFVKAQKYLATQTGQAEQSNAHRPMLVVTPNNDAAYRFAQQLAFFSNDPAAVLTYPAVEVSPYADVIADRKASMERLATLFHLADGRPTRFVVTSSPALLRYVVPRSELQAHSVVVRAEDGIDRDGLIRTLVEGGYLRVPVVEDPGTFSVRGSILDVFPPYLNEPARIELDDYLVMSIKSFDPDTQKSEQPISELSIHPVRETLLTDSSIRLAKERLRARCDELNVPSSQTRALLDELESGRLLFGLESYLPAFYPTLDTLLDYLSPDALIAFWDPHECERATAETIASAHNDWAAKSATPSYPPSQLYITEDALAEAVRQRTLVVVHPLVVGGAPPDEERTPLSFLSTPDPSAPPVRLAADDHAPLVRQMRDARSAKAAAGGPGRDGHANRATVHSNSGHDHPQALAPLAEQCTRWLDEGVNVRIVARTRTQADRLASLLHHYHVAARILPAPSSLQASPHPQAHTTADGTETRQPTLERSVGIALGSLDQGFSFLSEGIVWLAEEEIFGGRVHRASRRSSKAKAQAFLEDLRELRIGDYVVHDEHGIGKYCGLEKKVLPRSRLEELQGIAPVELEVLVVEYAGGDRLYLPVSRLNQIQKFSADVEGRTVRVDKLGGQTFAKTKAKVAQSVRQLAEELLKLYAERAAHDRGAFAKPSTDYHEFEAAFPFDETPDQLQAIDEVLNDLEKPKPMDRIVCGDVGFGKTEVAMRAAFHVATQGKQVAVLCPTTVLAQQHYQTFAARMDPYALSVRVLSRFAPRHEQTETLQRLREGKVDVVIGTHRLLSKDVHFKQLGLLVVDEEQRFGVVHKERIKQLRASVDVLTLSATPIPRTLQMAIGGMRDLSLITTPPVDRRAVRTWIIRWDDHMIREAVRRELARGGQLFFVYNRIDGLYERAQRLQALVPEARIAVAHGQLKETALEQTMSDFVDGHYDVLCATAIIESGLDIPRANTILIDRADMFGLAQLYQLRGRVGRSKERAYCYLITPPPNTLTDEARSRLEALERFTELGSGFHIASLDMELRGAGDILGSEQSGNVAAVGFDLFVQMLEQAVSELRGEPVQPEIDPELNLDVEHFLPDDYVSDVGLRLSLYKRLASVESSDDVTEITIEMEDRFGPLPEQAVRFVRAMRLKPPLRALRVLGCEATKDRVVFHLSDAARLDPAKVTALITQKHSPWKLTPQMKLVRRFDAAHDTGPTSRESGDTIDGAERAIAELQTCMSDPTG
jgi:transcription-repair coupling factor (superfamily II helicase)